MPPSSEKTAAIAASNPVQFQYQLKAIQSAKWFSYLKAMKGEEEVISLILNDYRWATNES